MSNDTDDANVGFIIIMVAFLLAVVTGLFGAAGAIYICYDWTPLCQRICTVGSIACLILFLLERVGNAMAQVDEKVEEENETTEDTDGAKPNP